MPPWSSAQPVDAIHARRVAVMEFNRTGFQKTEHVRVNRMAGGGVQLSVDVGINPFNHRGDGFMALAHRVEDLRLPRKAVLDIGFDE